MKKVAILSDTHGLLREEVREVLMQADIIIHAGDINTQAIVEELKNMGELYIVRGNNDKEWAEGLALARSFQIEDVNFFLVHNKKDIPKDLKDVQIIIYGHSHKYEEKQEEGVLYLNPGSCGKRRFDLELSMCMMKVEGKKYVYDKIIIPNSKNKK